MTYDEAARYLASRIDEIDLEMEELHCGPIAAVKLAHARDVILGLRVLDRPIVRPWRPEGDI